MGSSFELGRTVMQKQTSLRVLFEAVKFDSLSTSIFLRRMGVVRAKGSYELGNGSLLLGCENVTDEVITLALRTVGIILETSPGRTFAACGFAALL